MLRVLKISQLERVGLVQSGAAQKTCLVLQMNYGVNWPFPGDPCPSPPRPIPWPPGPGDPWDYQQHRSRPAEHIVVPRDQQPVFARYIKLLVNVCHF